VYIDLVGYFACHIFVFSRQNEARSFSSFT
jgi:hypothetical protein